MWIPNSGRRLEVDGTVLVDEENLEYPRIYDRFAELIGRGESQLDASTRRAARYGPGQ
jgi:D-galactose 1-dehydrogenase/L-arabinose 1- dehydrogenase